MTFYLDGRSDGFSLDDGIGFNIDGTFLYQEAKFRLKESNWWIGANYLYTTAANTFDLGSILPPEFPDPGFDFDLAALGIFIQYDSRNSVFTPSSGLSAKFDYKSFGDIWGSDFSYNNYKGSLFHYTPFGDYSSLGLRLAGQAVSGNPRYWGSILFSMSENLQKLTRIFLVIILLASPVHASWAGGSAMGEVGSTHEMTMKMQMQLDESGTLNCCCDEDGCFARSCDNCNSATPVVLSLRIPFVVTHHQATHTPYHEVFYNRQQRPPLHPPRT